MSDAATTKTVRGLSPELFEMVVRYLAQRPYLEVQPMIQALMDCKLVAIDA